MLRLRLMQGLSPEVMDGLEKPGVWVIDGLDLAESPLVVVPLATAFLREYRDPDDTEMRSIICSSVDGIVGVGDPGGDCTTCELSKWGENRQRPACDEIRAYLCWLPSQKVPIYWAMHGAATPVAKRINTQAALKQFGNFGLELTSKEVTKGQRRYFQPIIHFIPTPAGTPTLGEIFGESLRVEGAGNTPLLTEADVTEESEIQAITASDTASLGSILKGKK